MAKHNGIKLDLENYIYWLQNDKLKNVTKQEQAEFEVGQEIDLVALTKRTYDGKWYFGFGNESDCNYDSVEEAAENVVQATVSGKGNQSVFLNYLRREESYRKPMIVTENGLEGAYCAPDIPGVEWNVSAYFQDKFILRGKAKELVSEKGFSVKYKAGAVNDYAELEIQIGSLIIPVEIYVENQNYYAHGSVKVLGWSANLDADTGDYILTVDLYAEVCYPIAYQDWNPYSDEDFSDYE